MNTPRYIKNKLDSLYFLLFTGKYEFDLILHNWRDKLCSPLVYKVKKCIPF